MKEQIEKIILAYELGIKMLTPKSYHWKAIAEKMYKIAKETKVE